MAGLQEVFNIKDFNEAAGNISLQGDAYVVPRGHGVLQLTKPIGGGTDIKHVGRALYASSVPIWDKSFKTSFTFTIEPVDAYPELGEGIIFFLAPPNTVIPENSSGGYLGIADSKRATNPFVGVEFDTYHDQWDPQGTHIGINVNSLISLEIAEWKNKVDDVKITAIIEYSSGSNTLTATFQCPSNESPVTITQNIDLKNVLPANVKIGLAAAQSTHHRAYHKIHSWSFSIQP